MFPSRRSRPNRRARLCTVAGAGDASRQSRFNPLTPRASTVVSARTASDQAVTAYGRAARAAEAARRRPTPRGRENGAVKGAAPGRTAPGSADAAGGWALVGPGDTATVSPVSVGTPP